MIRKYLKLIRSSGSSTPSPSCKFQQGICPVVELPELLINCCGDHPGLGIIFGAFQCNFTTFYIGFSGEGGPGLLPNVILVSHFVRWLLVTGSTFINFAQVRVVRSRVVDSRPSSLVDFQCISV